MIKPRFRISAGIGVRLVALCVLSAAANAQPAAYQIDPEHFSVGFLVDHLGYAKVLGMFRESSGSYAFDEKKYRSAGMSQSQYPDSLAAMASS